MYTEDAFGAEGVQHTSAAMHDRNKHGLSRYIPSPIAQSVRRRCGFGCVVCGMAVYQYEHFDPEFADATEHKAQGITLLGGACHDRKTRGLLSLETVKSANEHPKCLQSGFSFGPFDVGSQLPTVIIGSNRLECVRNVLCIGQTVVIGIDKPEEPGGPVRLSAWFHHLGHDFFRIEDNWWIASSGNWDVELEGQYITIRRAARDIILKLKTDPPNVIIVERLDFHHGAYHVWVDGDAIHYDSPRFADAQIRGVSCERVLHGITLA
jgi:hypothetical protein